MIIKSGDVILVSVQFVESNEIKTRPAVVLYEEFDNFIIAGITSNLKMGGIPLSVSDGAIKPSIIKLNYIFTISSIMIKKKLFSLTPTKKQQIYEGLIERLEVLKL